MKSWSRRILRGISLKTSSRVLIHRRINIYILQDAGELDTNPRIWDAHEYQQTECKKWNAIVSDEDYDIYIYIYIYIFFFFLMMRKSSDLLSTIFDNYSYSKSCYVDIMCLLHTSFSEHSLRFLRAFVRMQSSFLHCPEIVWIRRIDVPRLWIPLSENLDQLHTTEISISF